MLDVLAKDTCQTRIDDKSWKQPFIHVPQTAKPGHKISPASNRHVLGRINN